MTKGTRRTRIERIYAEDFLVHQNHLYHLHFPKLLSSSTVIVPISLLLISLLLISLLLNSLLLNYYKLHILLGCLQRHIDVKTDVIFTNKFYKLVLFQHLANFVVHSRQNYCHTIFVAH